MSDATPTNEQSQPAEQPLEPAPASYTHTTPPTIVSV